MPDIYTLTKNYLALRDAIANHPDLDSLLLLQPSVRELEEYLDADFQRDYEADERGELPNDFPRALISQDGLYNLLCENDRLLRELAMEKHTVPTNAEIIKIAMAQSAIDLNCSPDDFTVSENKVVISAPNPDAHRYLSLPFALNLLSYGSNIVASVSPELEQVARDYINKYPVEHCFETPNLHALDDALAPYGYKTCFMAEYFLPDVNALVLHPCKYQTKMLTQPDFKNLYTPEWSNALCERRRHLDVLGIGAYDGDKLIGLAACSADARDMWQIGIDVLPNYRRQGIASALTSALAYEILNRGKVPFYCAAWSNIKSVRNALKCGFKPAWAELTAKPVQAVEEMNK